jgi:hypothetical protein
MGFKAFNIIMALLFVLAASVQLNDPDSLVWISLYLSATVLCVAHAFQKLPSYWAAAFALVASLWALTLVPTFWGQVSLTDVFGHVGMKTEEVEVAREFGGLMIVAVWMGVLERR